MVGRPLPTRKRARALTHLRTLVILDMNGVLLVRRGQKRQNAELRPHLDTFLATLGRLSDAGRVAVAVWSSMMAHNLYPLVELAFGARAAALEFVWDHDWCTQLRVPGMSKPLLRKDLVWLSQSPWADYAPDRVLLIDDDPIKCTANPMGTAIHPCSFVGTSSEDMGAWEVGYGSEDSELLRVAAYLEALVESGCATVPEFVLSMPFETFTVEPSPAKWPRRASCNDAALAGAGEERRACAEDDEDASGSNSIEAYWPEDDTWLPAELVEVLPGGSMRIHWDGCESVVPSDYVRGLDAHSA
mmetsp:Transcript_89440/g.251898  ORF Transcript_89440/g.251898 Transcript_89440/m.251898 type:complete len:301 (+) Transcript_89440:101-1003(+)